MRGWKKYIVLMLLGVTPFLTTSVSYAAEDNNGSTCNSANSNCIIVTEDIPGANCTLVDSGKKDVTNKRYQCPVEAGFGGVMSVIAKIIQYLTFLAVLVGIFMLVASGIQMSLAGGLSGAKEDAKNRIEQVIQGFVLLFATGYILSIIAPWVYH